MSRKRKRGPSRFPEATVSAEQLPPESRPHKYYTRLVFANAERGSGPLCIVGRELQLVWYATKRDLDRNRNARLVSVLEFRDCWRSHGPLGDRYHFTAAMLEEMSDEYRDWVGHQMYRGRSCGEEAEVLETEVHFSVAVQERTHDPFAEYAPAVQPFVIHRPEVHDLSSPQLDMLFEAMSLLYQNIPAMMLMEELRLEHIAEQEGETARAGAGSAPQAEESLVP